MPFLPWEIHKSVFDTTKNGAWSEKKEKGKNGKDRKKSDCKIATLPDKTGHPRGSSKFKNTSMQLYLPFVLVPYFPIVITPCTEIPFTEKKLIGWYSKPIIYYANSTLTAKKI